jgi:hypothetical protein
MSLSVKSAKLEKVTKVKVGKSTRTSCGKCKYSGKGVFFLHSFETGVTDENGETKKVTVSKPLCSSCEKVFQKKKNENDKEKEKEKLNLTNGESVKKKTIRKFKYPEIEKVDEGDAQEQDQENENERGSGQEKEDEMILTKRI